MQEVDLAGKTIVRVAFDGRDVLLLYFTDGTSIMMLANWDLFNFFVGDKEVEVKSNGD